MNTTEIQTPSSGGWVLRQMSLNLIISHQQIDPKSLDSESIRAAAQSDYEVVRQMASAPGATVIGTGAEIDAELNRRVREHVAGMNAADAATFTQIYNAEYNRLVTASLQRKTGCMVPIVIGTTFLFSIFLLSYTLLAAVLLGQAPDFP
jgi:hypothetical protein